jgi:hypothetical protein
MRKVTVSIPVPDVHPINNRVTRKVAVVPLTMVQVTKQKAHHAADAHRFRKEDRKMRKAAKAEAKKSPELLALEQAFEAMYAFPVTDDSPAAYIAANYYQRALADYTRLLLATNDAKKMQAGKKILLEMQDKSLQRLNPEEQALAQQLGKTLSFFAANSG